MTTANDVSVVELTNTAETALAVTMHLGGASRRVTVLAPGRTVVLVSPPGSTWSFGPTASGNQVDGGARSAGGDADMAASAPPEDGDEDVAPEGDGGRGEAMTQ